MKSKINTLFLDLDGCVFEEEPTISYFCEILSGRRMPKILDGVQKFLCDWVHIGNKLILTTGRGENFRKVTEDQLNTYGISYDMLIMNAGTGIRILVNNNSSIDNAERAIAININTNENFTDKISI